MRLWVLTLVAYRQWDNDNEWILFGRWGFWYGYEWLRTAWYIYIYTVDLSWACCKYQHKCKGYKTHCGSSGVPSPFQMGHRVYWYHRSQLLNYYVCILCAIWNLYLSCGGGYISFSYIAMWKTFVNLPVLSFSPISRPPPNPPLIKKMNHAYPPMTCGSRFSNETKVLRISIISFQDRTDWDWIVSREQKFFYTRWGMQHPML